MFDNVIVKFSIPRKYIARVCSNIYWTNDTLILYHSFENFSEYNELISLFEVLYMELSLHGIVRANYGLIERRNNRNNSTDTCIEILQTTDCLLIVSFINYVDVIFIINFFTRKRKRSRLPFRHDISLRYVTKTCSRTFNNYRPLLNSIINLFNCSLIQNLYKRDFLT